MDDKKIVDETTEKNEDIKDETLEKTEEETSKNASEDNSENEDNTSEKQDAEEKAGEDNPYKKQLKEMEEKEKGLKTENEDLKYNKKKAIEEEREKRKDAEDKMKEMEDELKIYKESDDGKVSEKYLTKEKADEYFDNKLKKQNSLNAIDKLTDNADEKAVIRKYVKNGYSVEDAYLKANAHIIKEQKGMEQEQEQGEELMANFSAGQSRGARGEASYKSDPIKKKAAEGLTPEEKKYL